MRILILLFFSLIFCQATVADVVKPALIEINVYTDGLVDVELRASIEALLTGINAKYKNTTDSPRAEDYDHLRKMSPDELGKSFKPFYTDMIASVELKADGKKLPLKVHEVKIPERGYTKIPRISVIHLHAEISRHVKELSWYYPERYGDNAVRVRQIDAQQEKWHWSGWQWLRNDETSTPFDLTEVFTRPPLTETISTYLVAGFEHILPKGLDHILFILGIFLLSLKMRPLLTQVTMFTVAHSITLGLAMNGIINLPANIVEPLIALSIAYIGVENIFHKTLHNSRLLIVFCFGLLHGLGFASVLADFGMPDEDFMTALISFNVGVEFGQIAIITMGFLTVGYWFRDKIWYRKRVIIPGSFLIAVTGLYWTWDRIIF